MTRVSRDEYFNLLKKNVSLVHRTKHTFWKIG